MNSSPRIILGLLSYLFIRAQFAAAGAIPTTIETFSQSPSTSSIVTMLSSATSTPLTSAISAAAQHQPHTGNDLALDPFGLLQSTQQGGQEAGDGGHQDEKHSSTSKTSGTVLNGAITAESKPASIAISSMVAGHSGTENRPETSTSPKPNSSATRSSSTQSSDSSSAPSKSTPPEATPTRKEIDPNSDSSSGSGMNSWKIIGIGVMSVAGVTLLVIGTAFHDAIFRALCGSFRRRKEGEEVLVPDWHRGSWRFGEDGYGLEKSSDIHHQDEEGPRIPEGEKANLAFPLPPISPFPLRRAPSTNTGSAEAGLAGVGAGGTGVVKSQRSRHSHLPSPPGSLAREPSQSKRKSICAPSAANPLDGYESDVYGGIE